MSEPTTPSDSDDNRRFRQMADQFIDTANRQLDKADPSTVNSAFLYGASRFSAFVTTQKAGSLEQFDEMHEEAVSYYTEEFRNMLLENLDHHRNALKKNN